MHLPSRNAPGSYVAYRQPQFGHLIQPFEYVVTSNSGFPLSNTLITHLRLCSTASAAIVACPET